MLRPRCKYPEADARAVAAVTPCIHAYAISTDRSLAATWRRTSAAAATACFRAGPCNITSAPRRECGEPRQCRCAGRIYGTSVCSGRDESGGDDLVPVRRCEVQRRPAGTVHGSHRGAGCNERQNDVAMPGSSGVVQCRTLHGIDGVERRAEFKKNINARDMPVLCGLHQRRATEGVASCSCISGVHRRSEKVAQRLVLAKGGGAPEVRLHATAE